MDRDSSLFYELQRKESEKGNRLLEKKSQRTTIIVPCCPVMKCSF